MSQVFVVKSLTPAEEHEALAPIPWYRLPLYGYKKRMQLLGIRNAIVGFMLLCAGIATPYAVEIATIIRNSN